MSETKQTPAAELSFEAALERLEAIVRRMESGETPLDEGLALYEEGIALVRRCTRELDEAEQRVKILQRTETGEILPTDFATMDD